MNEEGLEIDQREVARIEAITEISQEILDRINEGTPSEYFSADDSEGEVPQQGNDLLPISSKKSFRDFATSFM